MTSVNQPTEQDLKHLVAEYIGRVSQLGQPAHWTFTIGELRKKPVWAAWEKRPGIYYFVRDGIIQYVGRAFSSVGLGGRVINQITAYGDPKWDEVINDRNAICGLYAFDDKDWHWVASLEVFLIDRLKKPRFNKRYG